ncbi:MAG: stage III sporulation protein AB [Eubacteriales bacterium]|nr:stage III sporulation protein AB [Eubacteriales bacterium]
MKIIGIILILLAGTSFGMYYSFKPIYRKNDLLEMKRAILILNSEIKFLSTSIKEALLAIENSIALPIKNIFFNFRQNIEKRRGEELYLIWEESLQKSSKNTYFIKEDIEKFKMIGKSIGSYDKELNLNSLNIILDYIDTSIKDIENEKLKNMKMYQSVGILGSLALIILLI